MIKHNGAEISDYTINVSATQSLCSGVASATITLAANYPVPISVWDVFEVEGMPSFYVSSVSRELPEYTIKVVCQDATKRLTDYYVSENYQVVEGQTNYYWLDKILSETGIQFNITDDYYVSYLNPEAQVGMSSAMDIITSLVQQGGCFFYVDTNNVLQIKKVNKGNPIRSFSDTEILSINTKKDDKMLRNRVIVRGKGNPLTQVWVQAEIKVNTPYNYDEQDIRTSAMYNSLISEQGLADSLAKRLSDELRKITLVTTVEIPGGWDITIGDTVYLQSNYRNGECLVTTVAINKQNSGYITTLILDERCARILGITGDGGYVYIGTEESGIWRKPLKGTQTWEDFSTGLDMSYVKDLDIYSGIYSTALGSGLAYYRTLATNSWLPISGGILVDEEGNVYTQGNTSKPTAENYFAAATCVDKTNGNIYVAYNTVPFSGGSWEVPAGGYSPRSWLCTFSPKDGSLISGTQITNGSNYLYSNVNIQSDGKDVVGQYITEGDVMNYDYYYDVVNGDEGFTNLRKTGTSYPHTEKSIPYIHSHKVYGMLKNSEDSFQFSIFDLETRTFTYSPEFNPSADTCTMYYSAGVVYANFGNEGWYWNIADEVVNSFSISYTGIVYKKWVISHTPPSTTVYISDWTTNGSQYTFTNLFPSSWVVDGGALYYSLRKDTLYVVKMAESFSSSGVTISVTRDEIDLKSMLRTTTVLPDAVVSFDTGEGTYNLSCRYNTGYAVDYVSDNYRRLVSCTLTKYSPYSQTTRHVAINITKTSVSVEECPYSSLYSGDFLLHQNSFHNFGSLIWAFARLESTAEAVLVNTYTADFTYFDGYGYGDYGQAIRSTDLFGTDKYTTYSGQYSFSRNDKLIRTNVHFEPTEYKPIFADTNERIIKTGENVLIRQGEYIVYGTSEEFDGILRMGQYPILRRQGETLSTLSLMENIYKTEINQGYIYCFYSPLTGSAKYYDVSTEEWVTFDSSYNVQDMRHFFAVSGTKGLSGNDYFLLATVSGTMLLDREGVVQWLPINTIHCETTNTGDIPYVFAEDGDFYQKDREIFPSIGADFTVRNTNKPANVTVIRCDDEI